MPCASPPTGAQGRSEGVHAHFLRVPDVQGRDGHQQRGQQAGQPAASSPEAGKEPAGYGVGQGHGEHAKEEGQPP